MKAPEDTAPSQEVNGTSSANTREEVGAKWLGEIATAHNSIAAIRTPTIIAMAQWSLTWVVDGKVTTVTWSRITRHV